MRRAGLQIVIISLVVVLAWITGFIIGVYHVELSHSSLTQYSVKVSTTTSLYQLGVLDDLFSDFNNVTGLNAKFDVLAKGSGEALRLLADGSTCIGFVHAPALEQEFITQGKIERLALFAYNEFIIVGPRSDPANVSSAVNAVEAFKRIYMAGELGLARFISRGDMSGTNIREIQLWNLAGLNPEGKSWYLKTGQSISQVLIIADNLDAYTLTDIGTYMKLENQGKLRNLVTLKSDPTYLINVYSMYLSKTTPCDDPYTWYIAFKLRDYLLSRGQDLISIKYMGLLNPVKGREDMVLQAWLALTKLS
jgi:tungstate transport system substrate-binding protein